MEEIIVFGTQAFLVFDEGMPDTLPIEIIFNTNPGLGSPWRFVPMTIVPPTAGPGGVCLKRTTVDILPLLPNALLHGVFLKKPEIVACLREEEIEIPTGRLLKAQLVDLLLDAVLPETVSEAGLWEPPMNCSNGLDGMMNHVFQ